MSHEQVILDRDFLKAPLKSIRAQAIVDFAGGGCRGDCIMSQLLWKRNSLLSSRR